MLSKINFLCIRIALGVFNFSFADDSWYQNSYNEGNEIAQIKANQEQLEKDIKDINTKLDKVIKAIEGIKSPSQANNKPKQQNKRKSADPNKVHSIPQGNSYFVGNPNAKVTITEFYDFQ